MTVSSFNDLVWKQKYLLADKIESLPYVGNAVRGRWRAIHIGFLCLAGTVIGFKVARYGYKKFAAWFISTMSDKEKAIYDERKKQLFSQLKELKSTNATLIAEGQIRLLEIGIGSGANLEYYPAGTILKAVDLNNNFKKYFDAKRIEYPQIISGDILVAQGENLNFIQSESMDVVVITFVLCSVSDIKKVVGEVYRILVPGGHFFFFEHVKEWDEKYSWRRFNQVWTDRLGFWSLMFDGCMLTRNPISDIQNAGFSDVKYERFYIDYVDVASPHIMGVATK